jgi:hypothetical protein
VGGQNLPFFSIATGSNYTLYGASVPEASAGQSEQLMFSTLTGLANNWMLDNIQFSSSPIPEPSVLGLCAFGCFVFVWRYGKRLLNTAT